MKWRWVLSGLAVMLALLALVFGGGALLYLQDSSLLGLVTSPTPRPGVTPTLTLTPTRTPTPLPEASPTPLPTLDLSIAAETEETRLAADGRSTVPLRLTLINPRGVDLSGLMINFRVTGGGEVIPPQLPATAADLSAVYVAGESASLTSVTVTAILDVPRFERIQAEVNIALVRQEIYGELACGYAFRNDIPNQPLSVTLRENSESAALSGSYPLEVVLEGSRTGSLTSDPNAQGGGRVRLEGQIDQPLTLYYTPPDRWRGATEICISLTDRPEQAPSCVPLVWGPPASRARVRTRPLTTWLYDYWPVVWGEAYSGSDIQASAGLLRYQAVAQGTPQDATPLSLTNGEAWLPQTCQPLLMGQQGDVPLTLRPSRVAAHLRWELLLPGEVTATTTSVLAGQRQNLGRYDAPILLPDGTTLMLDARYPDEQNLYLFTQDGLDQAQPTTAVMVRYFVPVAALVEDEGGERHLTAPDGGAIPVFTSPENYRWFGGATNGTLSLAGEMYRPAYIGGAQTLTVNGAEETWVEIYDWGTLDTSALRIVNFLPSE